VCDHTRIRLWPLKIWRQNTGFLQGFCAHGCSVESQLIQRAEQLCGSGADCQEGEGLLSAWHCVTTCIYTARSGENGRQAWKDHSSQFPARSRQAQLSAAMQQDWLGDCRGRGAFPGGERVPMSPSRTALLPASTAAAMHRGSPPQSLFALL